MATTLYSTRKAIAEALAGRMPAESLLMQAKAEVESAASEIDRKPPPQPASPETLVSVDEAVQSLGRIFLVMENTMRDMRRHSGGNLFIDGDVADAFIDARKILTKYRYEDVIKCKNPLVLKSLKAR